jgi:hypothetical protein
MRNFLIFIAILAIAGFLYTHQTLWNSFATSVGSGLNLPSNPLTDPYAVQIRGIDSSNRTTRQVIVVDGDRWRIEIRASNSPKTIVVVSDGTQVVSNQRQGFPGDRLDPRSMITKVFTGAAQVSAAAAKLPSTETELCDGHTCWVMSANMGNLSGRYWVDVGTGFPVRVEASKNGFTEDDHLARIPINFSDPGTAEFFDPAHTECIFGRFLSP